MKSVSATSKTDKPRLNPLSAMSRQSPVAWLRVLVSLPLAGAGVRPRGRWRERCPVLRRQRAMKGRPPPGCATAGGGSDRGWCGWLPLNASRLAGGFEQFDEVAGGVGEQDLASAGAGDDVAAEGQSGAAEPVDLGVEVVDDEVDAVAARRRWRRWGWRGRRSWPGRTAAAVAGRGSRRRRRGRRWCAG